MVSILHFPVMTAIHLVDFTLDHLQLLTLVVCLLFKELFAGVEVCHLELQVIGKLCLYNFLFGHRFLQFSNFVGVGGT